MALNTHWKYMYADLIRDLAGTQSRSILKEFCARDAKAGEAQLFDSVGVEDEADATALASIQDSRKYYETLTAPDVADLARLLTPHKEIERARTQGLPVRFKTGHVFRSEDEVAQNAMDTSVVLRTLMRTIWKREDAAVIAALRAANQLRSSGAPHTFGNVAFPNGQILGAGGTISAYTKDIPTQIKRVFETNYLEDEVIYVLISPLTKQELIDQSGDKIQNKDFVDKSEFFTGGKLPDIQGCIHIVHPAVPDDEALAWSRDGIIYNQASPLVTKMGEDPGQSFNINLMIEEFVSVVRVDDKRVVQIAIDRST